MYGDLELFGSFYEFSASFVDYIKDCIPNEAEAIMLGSVDIHFVHNGNVEIYFGNQSSKNMLLINKAYNFWFRKTGKDNNANLFDPAELLKIRGSVWPIFSHEKVSVSYVVVEHFIDGTEKLLIDMQNMVHRINRATRP